MILKAHQLTYFNAGGGGGGGGGVVVAEGSLTGPHLCVCVCI